MPIFESYCGQCDVTKEWLGHASDNEPFCEACGSQMKRLVSTFGVIFTGALSASKYNDPNLEGAHVESHTAYRIRSSKSGKPEPVRIDSWSARKAFMRDEKLIGYEDVGPVEANPDGKWQSGRTGKPGTWV